MQTPQAEQGSTGMGHEVWQPSSPPNRVKQVSTMRITQKCLDCDDAELFKDFKTATWYAGRVACASNC